jgi:methyl-accepting chemotaxis protein
MFLDRFGITTRMTIGFGVTVALSVGLAVFAVLQTGMLGKQISAMNDSSGHLVRLLEEQRDMLALRALEVTYRRFPGAEQRRRVEAATAGLSESLGDSVSAASAAERRAAFQRIGEEMQAHITTLRRYAAVDTTADDRARSPVVGDAMIRATQALVDAARASGDMGLLVAATHAETAVAMVRLANLRFIEQPEPPRRDAFDKAAAAARAAAAGLGSAGDAAVRTRAADVASGLTAYQAIFEHMAATTLDAIALSDGQLQPQLDSMSIGLASLQTDIQRQFDAAAAGGAMRAARAQKIMEVLGAIALLVGGASALLIGRGIVRPLHGMTGMMRRLAGGETALDIPGRDGRDEIGDMARAVEVFRQQALANAAMTVREEQERALKDRHQAAMDAHIQDFGQSLSGVMGGFTDAAGRMRQAAAEVSEGSRRTRGSMTTSNQEAAASARDLATVAGSVEQMSASIREISQQVVQVSRAVAVAVERADQTNAKVGGLAEAADRIGDVIRLITDIAGKTNLLALNATIEAARAGEAGRGFAVVAGEVKALAEQTARATEQIGGQVVAIRQATGEALGAVREVGGAIGEVNAVATAIAAAIEQQAAATGHITTSVQTVSASTQAAAAAMGEVLEIAGATDTASAAALAAAEAVGTTANALLKEIMDFLAALSGGSEADRRMYERIPVQNATARLRIGDGPEETVAIRDISRGGMAVRHRGAATGTDTEVTLPRGGRIHARISRAENSLTGLFFRQDPASLRIIDGELSGMGVSALAAAE